MPSGRQAGSRMLPYGTDKVVQRCLVVYFPGPRFQVDEGVGTRTAGDMIVSRAAVDLVVAVTAADYVIPALPVDHIITSTAINVVSSRPTGNDLVRIRTMNIAIGIKGDIESR